MDKTGAELEAMLICLNWGHIISLPSETRQHMAIALQHPEVYAEKVKGAAEMLDISVQCASCNMVVTFIDDNLLLGPKPHNRALFVIGNTKEQKVDRVSCQYHGKVHNTRPRHHN